MYQPHDYAIQGLMIVACLAQLIPAYFSWRVYQMTGWVKYWTICWILFIFAMLWILLRRALIVWLYDPQCDPQPAWIFTEIISTIITSAVLTAYALLQYKFFSFWFQNGALKPGDEDNKDKEREK